MQITWLEDGEWSLPLEQAAVCLVASGLECRGQLLSVMLSVLLLICPADFIPHPNLSLALASDAFSHGPLSSAFSLGWISPTKALTCPVREMQIGPNRTSLPVVLLIILIFLLPVSEQTL